EAAESGEQADEIDTNDEKIEVSEPLEQCIAVEEEELEPSNVQDIVQEVSAEPVLTESEPCEDELLVQNIEQVSVAQSDEKTQDNEALQDADESIDKIAAFIVESIQQDQANVSAVVEAAESGEQADEIDTNDEKIEVSEPLEQCIAVEEEELEPSNVQDIVQ
ncbi:MAG: hypothetical protein ACK56I_34420, partial [bacterium]